MNRVSLTSILIAISGTLVLGSTVSAVLPNSVPSCAVMTPGKPLEEGYHGWYLNNEHKLDVPIRWSVYRTYRELASYGWCKYDITPPSAHNISEIRVEDSVGKFSVTSDFGPRASPCAGCSSFHAGIDVNTPPGISLFSPDNLEVSCKYDNFGGGIVAEFWYDDVFHQFLHLGDCYSGKKTYGDVFAITGSSGLGTGPHLDYRVKMINREGSKIRVYPPKEILEFVINPGAFADF